MSWIQKSNASLPIRRPLASVELDWPWPNWFRTLAPVLSRMWQKRRQRQSLLELDDHLLEDIGITREQAEREAGKWFWQ